jgi:hypothetical protein
LCAGRRRKVGNTGNNIVVVGDGGGHQGFGLGDYYVEEEYDGGKGKRGRKKVCDTFLQFLNLIRKLSTGKEKAQKAFKENGAILDWTWRIKSNYLQKI